MSTVESIWSSEPPIKDKLEISSISRLQGMRVSPERFHDEMLNLVNRDTRGFRNGLERHHLRRAVSRSRESSLNERHETDFLMEE